MTPNQKYIAWQVYQSSTYKNMFFFLIVVDPTTKRDYNFICVLLDVWEVETIAKYLASMPKYASRQVLSTEAWITFLRRCRIYSGFQFLLAH